MDFAAVLTLVLDNFTKHNIKYALIGGFAMSVIGYRRMTQDIDFLILQSDANAVRNILETYGYECLQQTEDVMSFSGAMGNMGRIDFLLAHRKYSLAMLDRAVDVDAKAQAKPIKVLRPEDIIGLKIQSSSNDPRRYSMDMADIEYIIKIESAKLDLNKIREYFALYDRTADLDALLKRINYAG